MVAVKEFVAGKRFYFKNNIFFYLLITIMYINIYILIYLIGYLIFFFFKLFFNSVSSIIFYNKKPFRILYKIYLLSKNTLHNSYLFVGNVIF